MSENIFNNSYSTCKNSLPQMALNQETINYNQKPGLGINNNKFNYFSDIATQNINNNKNNQNPLNLYEFNSLFPSLPLSYPNNSAIQPVNSEYLSSNYPFNPSLLNINYPDKTKLNEISAPHKYNNIGIQEPNKSFNLYNDFNKFNTDGKINIQHKIFLPDQIGNINSFKHGIEEEDSRKDGKYQNGI